MRREEAGGLGLGRVTIVMSIVVPIRVAARWVTRHGWARGGVKVMAAARQVQRRDDGGETANKTSEGQCELGIHSTRRQERV